MSERERGRRIFLGYTIHYSQDDVVEDLYRDVFPLYAAGSGTCETALNEWCSEYHLCEEWVLEVARNTMWWWSTAHGPVPKLMRSNVWPQLTWWFPEVEPGSEVGPRRKKRYRRRGPPLAPEPSAAWWDEPQPGVIFEHANRHYEWLAAYQVGGYTQAQLAKLLKDGVGKELHVHALAHALKRTANQIGLRLRPPLKRPPSSPPDSTMCG